MQQQHLVISNYKCSFRVKESGLFDTLNRSDFGESGWSVKRINNFIVLKAQGWVFIVFSNGFVNVTKIRNLSEEFESLVEFIKTHFGSDATLTIDNISASISLPYKGFSKLLKSNPKEENWFRMYLKQHSLKRLGVHYDFTTFPAVKIFTDVGTGLLFASGKLVLVGSKQESHIRWIVERVKDLLEDAGATPSSE